MEEEQKQRYARHFPLEGFGEAGQAKLLSASVLIIGAGGLGSPITLYLAAAGVGRIGVLDHDQVELSNLQRQVIHRESTLGGVKVASAREAMLQLNSTIEVEAIQDRLTRENAETHFKGWDLVVDATDSIEQKLVITDACTVLKKDYIWGSIQQYQGQVMSVRPGKTACYRCLYPELPDAESLAAIAQRQRGVLGVIPGITGCYQAAEVLKIITGAGEPLFNQLLQIDVWNNRHRSIKVPLAPGCSCNS